MVNGSASLSYVEEAQPGPAAVVSSTQDIAASPSPSVALAQVVAEMDAAVDVLTAEVLRRVWGTGGYDEAHMARDELASYLTPNLRTILQCLAEPGDPPPEAVASATRIGEARSL